jgi:hypothetical protein
MGSPSARRRALSASGGGRPPPLHVAEPRQPAEGGEAAGKGDGAAPSPLSASRTPRLDHADAVHPNLRYFAVKALYRVDHGVWDALVSVVKLHNQTINIWTHLAGAIGFAYMGAVIFQGGWPSPLQA